MATRLTNPYKGKDVVPICIRISKEHHDFLFESTCPRFGARQAIVGQLIERLANHLQADPTLASQILTKEQHVERILNGLKFPSD